MSVDKERRGSDVALPTWSHMMWNKVLAEHARLSSGKNFGGSPFCNRNRHGIPHSSGEESRGINRES